MSSLEIDSQYELDLLSRYEKRRQARDDRTKMLKEIRLTTKQKESVSIQKKKPLPKLPKMNNSQPKFTYGQPQYLREAPPQFATDQEYTCYYEMRKAGFDRALSVLSTEVSMGQTVSAFKYAEMYTQLKRMGYNDQQIRIGLSIDKGVNEAIDAITRLNVK
jgi:hypothetical protein